MTIKRQQFLLPVVDLILFVVALILAYTLRFGLSIPSDPDPAAGNDYALQLQLLLPWVVITHLVLYFLFTVYRGIWRYSGPKELMNLGLATVAHFAIWSALNLFFDTREVLFDLPVRELAGTTETQVLHIPWIILATYSMLAGLATAGVRVLPRVMSELGGGRAEDAAPTLIVGAGDAADTLLRSLQRQRVHDFRLICAVTELRERVGLRLHGVPVVATVEKIGTVISQNGIRQVLIAVDNPTPERLRSVVEACSASEVAFQIVPSMQDISEGRVEVQKTRRVEIEDLLGRETVKFALAEEKNYLRGEVVLITGAGGSIGSELARQAAACGAGRIVLLGKGENSIFDVTEELRRRHPATEVIPAIGDVRDAGRMDRIFSQHRPSVVFHAAAHKHVPLMENTPDEAVKNNIIGTANAVSLSDAYGVKRFVLISTDKAVHPASVMGATKRYAEKLVFAMAARSQTRFVVVRFGNVLGSRGSVIPLFRSQIEAGGPVTVTHADVTRYFMTIPEAVALVLQAGSRDAGGPLFVLDMGTPIRIHDLARNMITLSGLRPDADIEIRMVGLRPGEKLTEELFYDFESVRKTDVEKLLEAEVPPTASWDDMTLELENLGELATTGQQGLLIDQLQLLVPEYTANAFDLSTPAAPLPDSASTVTAVAITSGDVENPDDEPVEEEVSWKAVKEKEAERPVEVDLFEGIEEEEEGDSEVEVPADEDEDKDEDEERGEVDEGQSDGDGDGDEDEDGERGIEAVMPETKREFGISDEEEGESDIFGLTGDDAEVSGEASEWNVAASEDVEVIEEDIFNSEPIVSEAEALVEASGEAPEEKLHMEAHFPVEPATVQTEADGPAEVSLDAVISSEEEDYQPMSNPNACCLLMRVSKGIDAETLGMLFSQMKDTILRPADCLVLLADKETAAVLPEGAEKLLVGEEPQGATIAKAMAAHPEQGVIMTLSSEVLLAMDALETITAELAKGDTPLVYSDFEENRDGVATAVHPHDHEGCPHERFEYGPVIAYRRAAIESVGGIRTDLSFAWEYDLHLKLMEKAPFRCIRKTLYTVFLPSKKAGKGSAVYSPGMGPLGGFSYVFYPEDMEREVTSVFEEAMKRRGTWIDHETAVVNHGGREYEVMVSVVTPILNRVKYIGNAIEKLQQQTYSNWEHVIVDNGSKDGTIELIQKLAEKDPRIRLIHGKGGSIASALNEGIRAARGKYIGQLDSDDEYDPKCIEKMVEKLESNPRCGLAISYYRLMDEHGKVIEDIAPVTHKGYSRNQIIRRDGAGATRFFVKAVLEDFGYYDEVNYGNFGEDYDMVVKTGEKYDVERVHDVLYYYRRHEDNTDVTRDPVMKYKNKNNARQDALRRRLAINKKLGKA